MRIKRMMAALLAGIMVFGTMTTTCLAAQTDDEVTETTDTVEITDNSEATEETDEADVSGSVEVTIADDGSYTVTYGGMTWTLPADSTDSVEDTEEDTSEEETEVIGTGTVVNVNSRLNLRSGAGTDYSVIGQLLNGTEVEVIGQDGNWYEIVVPEMTGYVYGDYLDVSEGTVTIESDSEESLDSDMLTLLLYMMMLGMDTTDDATSDGLTPDGNLTLVDDIGSTTEAGQQFITLQSKDGNTFYLIIDRDDDGDENVYFLNLVDEADLLALMDEDEAAEYTSTDGVTNTDEDFADTSTTFDTEDTENTEDVDAEADESTDTEDEEKSSSNMLPLVFVVLLLVGGGGAYFFMQTKKKQKTEERPDPDADYRDDDDEYVLPEDEELGSDSEDYDDGYTDDEPV
ncbi:MAG: DUF4366 domain-containing protein [Clostridiales bacterium]|nr:DUF4366 domain-containing protein [Clostridiales bacterium]